MIVTGTIQKQAWLDGSLPPIEQVRPRVWSVPVEYPGNPIRHTYCYLLIGSGGDAVIVDPGWDSAPGRAMLARGLELAGVDRVVGVVVTHFHIDHIGMVAHAAAGDAWIGMSAQERDVLKEFDDIDRAVVVDRSWLADLGAPEYMAVDRGMLSEAKALPRPTAIFADGETLALAGRAIRVVHTPGHTPGHICLVDEDENVILTGDHVLPRISPNVGLTTTGPRSESVDQYLSSLERVLAWDAYEVLPAHEYRFTGLAERARSLAAHHAERAKEILAVVAVSPGVDVWTIAARVHWARPWASLDGMHLRAALSETAAHVDFLVGQGRLEVTNTSPRRFAASTCARESPSG